VAHQPWVFLLLVNVALLLLGTFLDPLPAMLLTAPLSMPLAQVFKIDMAQYGIVMTANLAIALYTPPVGGPSLLPPIWPKLASARSPAI
jgi:C4-dicarboxylate transporter DctM subunit